jgi:plastocyanin
MFYKTLLYHIDMLAKAMVGILLILTGLIVGLMPVIIAEPNALAQNTNTTAIQSVPPASSSHKIFYLFSAEHEGVNETKLGIPPDTYSPDLLEVTEGDNVTIHFYNLDTTDRHTFTIGAPYNINEDLLPGTNATFTFKAADEGVFRFYCTYHQPIMSGQLVVLPPPSVEKPAAATVVK